MVSASLEHTLKEQKYEVKKSNIPTGIDFVKIFIVIFVYFSQRRIRIFTITHLSTTRKTSNCSGFFCGRCENCHYT